MRGAAVTRFQGTAVVLFTVALATALVFGSPRYVFVVAALVVFGFVAVGYALLPQFNQRLAFTAPPAADIEQALALNGAEISAARLAEQFICVFELTGWEKLARWLLISGAAFYLLLARIPGVEKLLDEYPMGSTYIGFLVGMRAIVVAVSWYEEQRFMAHASVTWGKGVGATNYRFVRPETGYHGGTLKTAASDPIFVLFDPADADHNFAAHQLKFRSFGLARNARVSVAAAS